MFRRLSTATPIAATRAFASSVPCLAGLNSYAMFIKKHAGDKALKALPIPARGRTLAKWYRALSKNEVGALSRAGARVKMAPRKTKKSKFLARFAKSSRGHRFTAGKERQAAAQRAWAKKHA